MPIECTIILVLLAANAVSAMREVAIVSRRRGLLQPLAGPASLFVALRSFSTSSLPRLFRLYGRTD